MVFPTLSPMMMLSWFVMPFSTAMALSSMSWSGIWFSLEMNLFSFLILMDGDGNYSVEPVIKYFIVQTIGSLSMVIGFIFCDITIMSVFYYITILGLFMKLGFFPFHSWVPSVVGQSRYVISYLILTWQKLGPLLLLNLFTNDLIFCVSLVFMAIIGGIGGLNQHSIRMMSAYSSFVHNSWLICSLFVSFSLFITYFLFYSVSLFFLFYSCKVMGKSNLKSKSVSGLGAVSVFMLMGVPPFLGFVVKLIVFLSFPSMLLVFPILGSVISLKYYLSFFYSFMINSKTKFVLNREIGLVTGVCLWVNFLGFLLVLLVCLN